jgi:hypothetical protein
MAVAVTCSTVTDEHGLVVLLLLLLLLQALIDGKVLCVHGGLSPDIRTLDQVCS